MKFLGAIRVLGLDIGGANVKMSFVSFNEWQDFDVFYSGSWYFPFWVKKLLFRDFLENIRKGIKLKEKWEGLGVTLTAELADCFQTKREGVLQIARRVCEVFGKEKVFFLTVDGKMVSLKELLKDPLKGAATNWIGTAFLIGSRFPNCIMIDVGSTTTDIVPIVESKPFTKGRTDPERLVRGELIYTGVLRTNVASIVQKVPTSWGKCRVSSELFAITGDIHLVLKNIEVGDYNVDTPDGKKPSFNSALTRIARVVCADKEMLSRDQIVNIAHFIYEKQLQQIVEGLKQVIEENKDILGVSPKIVFTGFGGEFLGKEAAKCLGLNELYDFSNFIKKETNVVSTSVAAACMVGELLKKIKRIKKTES